MAIKILEQTENKAIVEVEVDYDRTRQQMLDALGCRQSVAEDAVARIPQQCKGKQKVVFEFFKLGYPATDEEVERELVMKSLTIDVYAQCAVIENDKLFADVHTNSVSWKDAEDRRYCLHYLRGKFGRCVIINRGVNEWYGWAGGVREYLGVA